MQETKIIVVKPKTISLKDRKKLEKLGFAIFEHTNPNEFVFKQPTIEPISQYVYTTCYTCGTRVYMLKEQLDAYRRNELGFFCHLGHGSRFTKKA